MKRILGIGLALACFAAFGAEAQVASPRSGGQGAPGIPPVSSGPSDVDARKPPVTTGSVVPSGKVKPPGAPLGAEDPKQAELDRRQRELDRRIRTGICRGC